MNDNSRKLSAWFRVAYWYLIIIAFIGVLLRFKFVSSLKIFTFGYLLHSHSHAAILGWVYSALYIALLMSYLPADGLNKRSYTAVFWLTQISITGMLFSFAAQGYGGISIFFSALHIILSYWFIVNFIRDVRKYPDLLNKHRLSLKFIFAALLFLFISSFGPWGLAVSSVKGGAGSDLYNQAVYFYLHFQYNGWFTFAVLGIWAWYFERKGNLPAERGTGVSFWILFFSVFPSYFLSLLGFSIPAPLKLTGAASALAQLAASFVIIYRFFQLFKIMNERIDARAKMLFSLSMISLFLKFLMQLVSVVPGAGDAAFISREVLIGYLHLVMLGFVTCGLFSWYSLQGLMSFSRRLSRTSLILFLAGLVFSEILLFSVVFIFWFGFQGIPYLHHFLLLFSIFMLAGLTGSYYYGISGKFKQST